MIIIDQEYMRPYRCTYLCILCTHKHILNQTLKGMFIYCLLLLYRLDMCMCVLDRDQHVWNVVESRTAPCYEKGSFITVIAKLTSPLTTLHCLFLPLILDSMRAAVAIAIPSQFLLSTDRVAHLTTFP